MKKNNIGEKFGMLLVLSETERTSKWRVKYTCLCDCGKYTSVDASNLRSGHTQSCGCLGIEKRLKSLTKHNNSKNKNRTKEYIAWCSLKSRCYNKNNKKYHRYGGRGIFVCERWLNSFENFLEDMGEKPSKLHSIDRINNDGNYEPSNCKWATVKEQSINRSTTRLLEYKGIVKNLSEWSIFFKVNHSNIQKLIKNGRTFNEVCDFYISKKRISIDYLNSYFGI